jgi:hypothetical protein
VLDAAAPENYVIVHGRSFIMDIQANRATACAKNLMARFQRPERWAVRAADENVVVRYQDHGSTRDGVLKPHSPGGRRRFKSV